MSRRKPDIRIKRSLFSVQSYFVFFVFISFIVTCSFLLFSYNMDLAFKDVRQNALITFGNILLLSLLCSLFDGIRQKYTIERPIRRILNATHRLTEGDFSARIKPFHKYDGANEFDAIIEDFNLMAEELSGIETLRNDFIANVSHELKTPLSVIHNYATLLQSPDLPEARRQEYARTVTAASRRLSALISNILKLNKLENQQIYPEAKTYPLGEQLRECVLALEENWEEKRLELNLDIEDITVQADAELLSIVWNNLLSNAVKFTEPGGGISVSLTARDETVTVTIADTGCGIGPEVGRHMFEKFYQGDHARMTEGNGLGLALVKRVIDIVGGEISVESSPGRGSAFTVKLRRDGR